MNTLNDSFKAWMRPQRLWNPFLLCQRVRNTSFGRLEEKLDLFAMIMLLPCPVQKLQAHTGPREDQIGAYQLAWPNRSAESRSKGMSRQRRQSLTNGRDCGTKACLVDGNLVTKPSLWYENGETLREKQRNRTEKSTWESFLGLWYSKEQSFQMKSGGRERSTSTEWCSKGTTS